MNAKTELLRLSGGEPIKAILMKRPSLWYDRETHSRFYKGAKEVSSALTILDFEFDDGYGSENGCILYAWTRNYVIIKSTYDGSEAYHAIPRNPADTKELQSFGGG